MDFRDSDDAWHSETYPVEPARLALWVFDLLLLCPEPGAELCALRVSAPPGDRRPLPCCQRQACCAPQSHGRSGEGAEGAPDVAGLPCEIPAAPSCACHPAFQVCVRMQQSPQD